MKNLTIHETICIHDLHTCSKQDLDTVSELVSGAHVFAESAKRKKQTLTRGAIFCHSFGVIDGLYMILCSQFGHVDKFSLVMAVFVILYCAKNGFDLNKRANLKKQEFEKLQEQYETILGIVENVPASDIHNIAEIYRKQRSNPETSNLDEISNAIRHIAIKYQR